MDVEPSGPPHDLALTAQRQTRAMLVYWGTSGAGIRFAHRITEEIGARCGTDAVAMSLHENNAWLDKADAVSGSVVKVRSPVGRSLSLPLLTEIPKALKTLRHHIRDFGADIVIIPMNFAMALPVTLMLRAIGTPYIYVIHDDQPHPGDYAPMLQRLTQKILLSSASGMVALSSFVGENIRHRFDMGRRHQLFMAPLALHARARRGEPRTLGPGPVRFLFLGRLLAYKGLDLLAEALHDIRDRDDWRLTIVGNGPERAFVMKAFAGLPQADTSRLEFLLENEVDATIDRHDVMICPYAEASQSGVLVEGFTAGLPAIVTPVGALPEQIGHGVAGWVAQHATAAALAETIRSVLDDRSGYQQRSAAALRAVSKRPGQTGWAEIVQSLAHKRTA
jgi:glycosyltransferase involved in cell wall biosynthesis